MTKRAFAFAATFTMTIVLAFALAVPAIAQAGTANPTVAFKMTADVKNTGSLTTYPGNRTALKVKVANKEDQVVVWASTNKKIAKVTQKGVVTAKAPGRCYIKATVGGSTAQMLVEVTSEKAY